ncbi:RIIA lysis inhibitor [Vibrio phage 11895-B1]|uniref:RIIA lysis inhibitor n=1 Tax=Vibrio phage 11895-B1 TaxID=754075 RepID=UPI0002C1439B|nr:RIIA lysis inhibitor [Vibrio phage 11895-B1]AGH32096.1 hypothetical protein VPHG_00029 [Vibrio phage 11895-B1]
MIPIKNTHECHTGKSIKAQNFGMEFNAKAFSILSDQLYTHKERACIREYCTNAYDVHVDSGKGSTPFIVHIPTKLEPYFEVQDQGFGLDEQGVMNTFATFFHSTKETNNNVNGCLGLGSKAGFTVSDQFTVSSIKDGVCRVFICYKDEEGTPVVSLKSETSTTSVNGVTIKIPVPMNNILKWQQEAKDIISKFNPLPIHNIKDEDFNKDLLDKFTFWEDIRKTENGVLSLSGSGESRVIMGNVEYPVSNITSYIRSKNLREMISGLGGNFSCTVKGGLGEFGIAPSREALSLDKRTKRTLSKKVTKLFIDKYRELSKQVSNTKDTMSYYTMYHNFHDTTIWDLLLKLKFPFTKGRSLSVFEDDHYYSNRNQHLYLLNGNVYENLVGFIPKIYDSSPSIMSKALSGINHRRLRKWTNIKVLTGEGKRIRDTFKNFCEINPEVGAVFYAEDEDVKNSLLFEFGLTEQDVFDTKDYIVDKVRQPRKKLTRTYGKLNDTKILARKISLDKEGIEFTDVDLLSGKVAYIEGETFNVSVTGKGDYHISVDSYHIKCIMKYLGVETVVIKNNNNKGKITKSGIPSLYDLWCKKVKENKFNFIKAEVWKDSIHLPSSDETLLNFCKAFKKITKKQGEVEIPENFPTLRVSALGLKELKTYQNEIVKRDKVVDSVYNEVKKLKAKLPLWDKVRSDEEAATYYLKLEKLLK